jgi:hypothetical protein
LSVTVWNSSFWRHWRDEIKHKPVAEQLTVGGQAFAGEAGQVFLVDLTTQPVQVTQVRAEVKDLITSREPGRDELKGAAEKLRSQHKNVQSLWPDLP